GQRVLRARVGVRVHRRRCRGGPGVTGYVVTSDLARIDLDTVHRWLSTDAYWALGRSREAVQTAAENSFNVAVLDADDRILGYARLVTDRVSFAWLCDVYVDSRARGRGVGAQLVENVVSTLD